MYKLQHQNQLRYIPYVPSHVKSMYLSKNRLNDSTKQIEKFIRKKKSYNFLYESIDRKFSHLVRSSPDAISKYEFVFFSLFVNHRVLIEETL